MVYPSTTLSLVEYGSPVDIGQVMEPTVGVEPENVTLLLIEAGRRVASNLGFSKNPISVNSSGVQAIKFAGLIRISSSLELEVAPKFLGGDQYSHSWKEDFFFLSNLSRYGYLMPFDRMKASGAAPRDLSTLVARSMVTMFEARKRHPLRSYHKVRETDFFIDGDLDPEQFIFPTADGYEQDDFRFDRKNDWNGTIAGAAKQLLPEISDPSIVRSLIRLIEELTPQSNPRIRKKAIPSRYSKWEPLYNLSNDVLKGLGVNYQQGRVQSPGYLVNTWRVWEDLLTIGARLGFGHVSVLSQEPFKYGTRAKLGHTIGDSILSVIPDCVIEGTATRHRMILDAKYKGHIEKGELKISAADVYESLAFSKATGCNHIVLAYPKLGTEDPSPVGTCMPFERVNIGGVIIIGVQVESRYISKVGGLSSFAKTFAENLSVLFKSPTT